MAEYVDLIVDYKRKLLKGCSDEKTMAILRKLKKMPMNVEILQETGIGRVVRNMKNSGGEIGAMAQNIYDIWKKAVVDSSHPKSKEVKHTKTQNDINKTKPKDLTIENHKGFHNEKVASSNNYTKTSQQHHSRSKIELKNKHKISDSYMNPIPEYSTYDDFHNEDNESENEMTTTDYLAQKKTVNHSESSIKSSHRGKDINKKCKSNTNCDRSHKQLREPQKKELSLQPNSSKQKSRTKSKTSKLLQGNNESFNSSNATFEDILGLNDTVNPKKRKPQSSLLSSKNNFLDTDKRESTKKSSGVKREASMAFARTGGGDDDENDSHEYTMEFKKPRPLQLDVDIDITLPAIQPNYKPLPHKDLDGISKKKKTTMSNEEAIMFTTPRRDRTAVYAGKRSKNRNQQVPSLYDQCVRVLIDNVDGLAYTGGVPYDILKPVLLTCSSTQLYTLESYNPDLLDDTDELWKIHCEREFKMHTPGDHETWRDLFIRLLDEREEKLKQIKASISASTIVKTGNVRVTKLAYVDSVAKPPRDIARRQAKHGTGLPSGMAQKAGPSSKATPRPTASIVNASTSSSSISSPAHVQSKKPRPAPLMVKTLKLLKQHLRR